MKSPLQQIGSKLLAGVVACISGMFLSTASAATLLQDFGTVGTNAYTMPADWQVKYRNNNTTTGVRDVAATIGTIPGTTETGLLLRRDGSSGSESSAFVSYTGTTDGIVAGKVADFSAEVTLRLNAAFGSTSAVGVAVRAQSTAYAYSGYFIGIQGTATGYALTIFKNPVSNADHGTSLDSDAYSFATGTDYILKISADGANISASVWSTTGETALATVSISNADILAAGYFGLRSGYGNSNMSAAASNFSITPIPEPASVALLLFAALLTLAACKAGRTRIS